MSFPDIALETNVNYVFISVVSHYSSELNLEVSQAQRGKPPDLKVDAPRLECCLCLFAMCGCQLLQQ